VLLLNDVVTSGGQVKECRRQLLERGASSVATLVLGVTQDVLPRACPVCGGILRLVTGGRYGDFVGCANYLRGCRYTEPPFPTAHALKRRPSARRWSAGRG
jgi:hypothetical protein